MSADCTGVDFVKQQKKKENASTMKHIQLPTQNDLKASAVSNVVLRNSDHDVFHEGKFIARQVGRNSISFNISKSSIKLSKKDQTSCIS